MSGDNRPISEIYYEVGVQWSEAEAAADIMDDLKSAFLSKKMQDYVAMDPKMALNRAESTVKASPEWEDYIRKAVGLRKTSKLP